MSKVTGKCQITLPKTVVEQCGIRVGDELDLRAVGDSILIAKRRSPDGREQRQDKLTNFDRATARQRGRQRARPLPSAAGRGWTREDLYRRDRPR